MRTRMALKLAEWALRFGSGAVMDYYDKVRLANTPTYGHRVYTSPDGRVLVIDPIMPETNTFAAVEQSGAKILPRRIVLQVTSYGQAPARAELSWTESMKLSDALFRYTHEGDPSAFSDRTVFVSGGSVPTSQR